MDAHRFFCPTLVVSRRRLTLALLFFLSSSLVRGGERTVTYQVGSSLTVIEGEAPEGAVATVVRDGSSQKEVRAGHSMTLSLSGYGGCVIRSLTLSMASAAKGGKGTFSFMADTVVLAEIAEKKAFDDWYDNEGHGIQYRPIHVALIDDSHVIADDETLILTIVCRENSLFLESFTMTYTDGDGGEDAIVLPEDDADVGPCVAWDLQGHRLTVTNIADLPRGMWIVKGKKYIAK